MKTIHSSASHIAEDDIQAFVDGVLSEDSRNEVLAHIVANPREAERVNAYFRQRAALERLAAFLEPDDNEAFELELQGRLAAALRRQRAFQHSLRVAAAVAVALPLALGGWWLSHQFPGETVIASAGTPEDDFAPVFPFGGIVSRADLQLAETGDVSLAQLDSRLRSARLVVPDLAAIGLKLVGGDLVPDLHPPAARLVYVDEVGHPLFVYVGLATGTAPLAFTLAPEGHISLNWRDGELVFAVVGPVDMPRLVDVMREVGRGITQTAELPTEGATTPVVVEPTPDVLPAAPLAPVPETPVVVPGEPTAPDEIGLEKPKVL